MKKRKGKIIIENLTFDDLTDPEIEATSKIKGFSVSCNFFQGGSCSPCRNEEEVLKTIGQTILTHPDDYFDVIDKRGLKACRECGCTENNACEDIAGDPCHWVEEDLCSQCRGKSHGPDEGE